MSRKVSNSILLDVAIEAALAASNSIMDSKKPKKNILYKGPADLVTEEYSALGAGAWPGPLRCGPTRGASSRQLEASSGPHLEKHGERASGV